MHSPPWSAAVNEKKRLARTRLIERVRTIEKSRAARASADAEAVSSRLLGVAQKTRLLATHYAAGHDLHTADDLRRQQAMRHQLHALSTLTDGHLRDAQRRADAAMIELGTAERKRARIESDRRGLERAIQDSTPR